MSPWRAALAAAVIAFAWPAMAEPPPVGWFGSFHPNAVVCNTQAEVRSIFDAGTAKPDGGAQARYMELRKAIGADGQPVCLEVSVKNVAAGESIPLGRFSPNADLVLLAWAVHIGTARGEWWMLYLEPLPHRMPASFGREV